MVLAWHGMEGKISHANFWYIQDKRHVRGIFCRLLPEEFPFRIDLLFLKLSSIEEKAR
jgi:hypothetical protein